MKLRSKRQIIAGIILVALANVLMIALLRNNSLYGPQTFFDDLNLRLSAQKPNPNIVIVAIDDKSLKTYGSLGRWDRVHYADLIRNLKDAGARVVALDVAFLNTTPSDARVADAIRYAETSQNGQRPMPVVLAVVPADAALAHVPGQGVQYQQFESLAPGIAAGRPILANVSVEPDGAIVRHLLLRAFAGRQAYFLLPFVAVNEYLGRAPLERSAQLAPNGIVWNGRLVPTDPAYRMLIDFVGPPHAFKTVSLSDAAEGKVDPATFKDKLVFVGATGASSLADNYPVPTSLDQKMDGVEIWANGAQNLLDGKFVAPQSAASTGILMVLLSVAGGLALFFLGVWGLLVTLALTLLYAGLSVLLTQLALNQPASTSAVIELPKLTYVGGTILLTAAALFVYFFVDEQRARRAVHRMFGKYVTPEVARHLMNMRDRGELQLGGEVKTATVMFGDIRGFTTLSEGMEPEAVMSMLNRYFDKMVDIIIKHGGTINKFIGDNVMVLFNLPTPTSGNHALAAVEAAHEIQTWIKQYRQEHPEEVAAFGFGVCSGQLVAGNMGSRDRMEYTVIGDTVNMANNLCGVAEPDEVAISETTLEMIKDSGAVVVDKGLVKAKGKSDEAHVFSVLALPQGR